jgi:uncharacterized protein YjdB
MGGAVRCVSRSLLALAFLASAACDASKSTNPLSTDNQTIKLDQASVQLDEGQSTRLRVLTADASREFPTGTDAVWSVANPEIASVSAGLIIGLKPGQTRVTVVISGRHSASADIKVLAVPGGLEVVSGGQQAGVVGIELPQPVKVRVVDRRGAPISGAQVEFVASPEIGGSVLPAVATAGSNGEVETRWTLGRIAGVQPLQVRIVGREIFANVETSAAAGPLSFVEVNPTDILTNPGRTTQFSVTARDEFGNAIPDVPFAWSSTDSHVATVDDAGLLTAVDTGDVEIQALATQSVVAGANVAMGNGAGSVSGKGRVRVKPGSGTPGSVSDLRVASATSTGMTLTFTEVGDGTGAPASYEMRYKYPPIAGYFSTATKVTQGTCATPIAGTAVGAKRSCTVYGLQSAKTYEFYVVAFRGDLSVSGGLSNVASGTTAAAALGRITVSPATGSITALGRTLQLSASATSSTGSAISNPGITWSSSNTGVATVDATGRVTATGVGSVVITANGTCCDAGTSTITVSQTVASVSLSPTSASIDSAATQQLTATARDANGNVIANPGLGWSSSNSAVATVNSSGQVTGRAPGNAQITASKSGVSAAAGISVRSTSGGGGSTGTIGTVNTLWVTSTTSGSAVLRFTEVNDGTGNPANYQMRLYPGAMGWNWGTAAVVAQGTCSAPIQGTSIGAERYCSVSGLQPSTRYDFQIVPFKGDMETFGALSNVATGTTASSGSGGSTGTLTISPSGSILLSLGATRQMSATARDGSGSTISNPGVTWNSSNTSVATVSSSGLITARAIGTAVVTAAATCCSSEQITVTVAQQEISSIVVSPSSASVVAGSTTPLVATARDASGNSISGVTFSWISTNTSVATVNSSGVVTGVSQGTATVRASANGFSGSSAVTVSTGSGGGGSGGGATGTGTVVWSSDWSAGGLRDGTNWSSSQDSPTGAVLSVVASSGLGFPSGMSNALRVGYPAPGGGSVRVENRWAEPSVGQTLYFRTHMRYSIRDAAGNLGASSHHPIQPKPGSCPYQWEFRFGSSSNGNVPTEIVFYDGPGSYQLSGGLSKNVAYLLEWAFTRVGTSGTSGTYTARVRINGTDVTSNFRRYDGAALTNAPATPISGECVRALFVGNNGPQWTGTSATADFVYYGGTAVCTGGWCGAWKQD